MKPVKKLLSLILTAVMLSTVVFGVPFSSQAYTASETSLADVSLSDWMSTIRDDTYLTEITLPGTHDSCARKFKTNIFTDATVTSISKCQSLNITQQLEAGIRFFDIRCEVDPDTYSMKTVHGSTDCWDDNDYLYLDYVFQFFYNFLDAHPSETLYVCIKEDDGGNGVPSFTNAVYEYIHGYSQNKYLYGENYNYTDHWYLGKSVPKLGAVRGKCVLFNRFDQYIGNEASQGVVADENESGQKIKYNDMEGDFAEPYYSNIYSNNTGIGTAHIQDYYKWTTTQKITATQYMLNLGHYRGEYYINFSSTVSDSTIPNPENLASQINPSYYTYTYNRNKPSGIYCMDFATADLARQIILNNEAVCAKVTGTDGNISYTLNRNTGTLTISGNGAMNNYGYTSDVGANGAGSNAPWGDQLKNNLYEGQYNTDLITNIVIEEGVTSIGNYAFYGFDHLTSVTIPSTVTSIGEGAFARCTALKTVDISNTNITSLGYMAFLGCSSLEAFYTADSVETFSTRIFEDCSSKLVMYGSTGIPSQTYANENSITYSEPKQYYSVNATSGNNYKESANPFAGRDLSKGVTISFSKYCSTNDDWNSALLNFSTGDVNDNRYFIFNGNGAVFFNDGNGGVGGSNNCYFDIRTSGSFNTAAGRWVDVTVTIYKNENGNHIMRYYTDGELAAEFNLSSISASGYPNGVSGNDGVFSYLSSDDINLYYGSSYTIYGSMGGTADSYIDNVKLYPYALSNDEIGAIDTSLCYEETFDDDIGGTATQRQSNDGTNISHQEYHDGRSGCALLPFSDGGTSNYIKAGIDYSPFIASDTSNGFTISYFQRVNGTLWTDKETITLAQGEIGENKYFTIGTEGYIRFNNGNGGSDGNLTSAGLYFDYTTRNDALVNARWQHVTVTILSDYHFKVYVDGALTADVTVTGTDNYAAQGGLLSFLADSNTRLYYGSYTPYWGTDTISLDNVKCYDHALSQSEVAALYRYDCESNPVAIFENAFGAAQGSGYSGFCEWRYGYGDRRGVLHFDEGSANGSVDVYVNGTQTSETSSIAEDSTVKVVYTGSGSVAGWENTVTNDSGTTLNTVTGNEYEFTLAGDSVVHYVGARTTYTADTTAFLEAYAKAQTYSADNYSATSFANLQSKITAYAEYNASMSQMQIDDATADILYSISALEPYLTLTVTAENGTPSTEGGTVTFGDTVELSATADAGYEFFAWYETGTKRLASDNQSFSFVITSNTELNAIFVPENSRVLRFENASGQLVKYIAKTTDEWNEISDLSALAPAVPYRYGYTDGAWDYGSALTYLQSGWAAVVTPVYTELETELPALPNCTDIPALTLSYELDSANNVGSFLMAVNVPDGVRVQSVGTAFYYAAAASFDPTELDLTINNRMTTSKFEVTNNVSGIYVTNINKLSSRYNWAARGYVTYYDASGTLRTAYSNQINIVNRENV